MLIGLITTMIYYHGVNFKEPVANEIAINTTPDAENNEPIRVQIARSLVIYLVAVM